jgi:putative intracellular protease/amidase
MSWENYKGKTEFAYAHPKFDSTKRTVVIVADNDGTENFDMMSPYYLFNATEKANVFIVAHKKFPITVIKGFYVLPHFSFAEFDLAKINPDILVIPNLSAMDSKHQNPVIVNWIKSHYLPTTTVLSVCDGSLTAAATGIYDGKPMTTHATDFSAIKKQYPKPVWMKDVSVTKSENLYSTAGVSNATEGSLLVIGEIFGSHTMEKLMKEVNYPHSKPKLQHESIALDMNNKIAIGRKIIFKGNRKIGILLEEGMNEFDLAAVTDTYNRTFPGAIESYVLKGSSVTSKYGLTIIPTGVFDSIDLDELHVFNSKFSLKQFQGYFGNIEVVSYDGLEGTYLIDRCLARIEKQYGEGYKTVTKRLLDYN